MSHVRDVYLLSPKDYSQEVIAVTFAKTSRSPESFREIAAELSDEASAQFHEKWVVGYGHSSVAEHAVLHIALENVSRLAIEAIESNRLASYTEKSTRYQTWDRDRFYTSAEIAASPHAALYTTTVQNLFDFYLRSLEPVRTVVQQKVPQREGESDARWDGRIRSRYVDASRFALPAAAYANVGMTANARVFENAIRKWLSHPLSEVREIGAEVKAVAVGEVPTLVKYANALPYLTDTPAALQAAVDALDLRPNLQADWVTLIEYTPQADARFVAALLYRFSQCDYASAWQTAQQMTAEQTAALIDESFARLDKYDTPLRELEYITYTFDTLMDQGAYFEVKRHRMMTQTPQRLSLQHGWATPALFAEAGLAEAFDALMAETQAAYRTLAAAFPEDASYIVPNAANRRLLMTFNLREAFHFCELRSAPNAHFSVRRLAQRMYDDIAAVHPGLVRYMRQLAKRPGWAELEAEHFRRTA